MRLTNTKELKDIRKLEGFQKRQKSRLHEATKDITKSYLSRPWFLNITNAGGTGRCDPHCSHWCPKHSKYLASSHQLIDGAQVQTWPKMISLLIDTWSLDLYSHRDSESRESPHWEVVSDARWSEMTNVQQMRKDTEVSLSFLRGLSRSHFGYEQRSKLANSGKL